jgi:ABC-2 type transport system ATP-binding protein
MKEPIISVNHFKKIYGDNVAVNDISFDVHQGEIFGLLGPNGSGKTSTLESLEGLRKPDGGSLKVLGLNPETQQRKLTNLVGIQLQSSALPANMTVQEAMLFFCAYHQSAPRFDLIERLQMGAKKNAQYGSLSIGQQRRLALALAVAHRPQLVFLDEPTAGLDVASRVELHALMRELQQDGTTMILATHDMAEAEKMSDRVAILLKGTIAAMGTPQELTASGDGYTRISVHTERDILATNGHGFPGVQNHQVKDGYALYFSTDPGASVTAIIKYVESQNDKLIDLRVERPTLEERFLEITKFQPTR